MKKQPLSSCLIPISLIGFCGCSNFNEQEKPNVVFIYADDLGYGDLSCYGSDSIYTPNIDRLAEEGIRFTDFYSAAPICTPSRAALLTGQYPIRNGYAGVFFHHSKDGIDSASFTMAEMFKENGYKTACIGKWHLGHQDKYHPLKHGFDFYFGLKYSNDMQWPRPWNNWEPDFPLPLYKNFDIVDQPVYQNTLTQRYTEEAKNFILENKDQPFFLYFPHTFPHEPLYASVQFLGSSKYGLYGDVVQELDHSVGDLMDLLDRLNLAENTIVVFSSDNGARMVAQRWGKHEKCGSNGILKARKATTFEGGIREPALLRWKGKVPGKQVESTPCIMTDWLPTFADLLNYDLPADRIYDGISLMPLLKGEKMPATRDFFFYKITDLNAIRSGKWKFKPAGKERAQGTTFEYDDLLFDLENDPGETNNLADEYPEIVEKMKLKIDSFVRETKVPAIKK